MNAEKNILRAIEEGIAKGKFGKTEKQKIAKEFGVPISNVESIYSFYSFDNGEDKICTGLPCALKRESSKSSILPDRKLEEESCLGYCDKAPVLRLDGKYVTMHGVSFSEIEESTSDYVKKHRESIDKYVQRGGYTALNAIMVTGGKTETLDILVKSGLKGMGGAGFPVSLKWESFMQNRTDDSILLVNAHEGEPGTFKDRITLELRPHELLEGALIAARVNGVWKIVIGLKKEYSQAMASLEIAIGELKELYKGRETEALLPGIEVARLGGSYVTGEETALMEGIEGRRSEPRLRPPFPTENGLFGKPTLVHNVETLAAIAEISRSGFKSFRKKYCVTGDVKKPGIYSAPLGTTAKEMIEKYAGNGSEELKAIMPGGLSGGILPASFVDLNLDFDSVRKAGAGMGTGALIVLSKNRCTVETLRQISEFFKNESCGKCMPCRYGTKEINEVLTKITRGKAAEKDIEAAKEASNAMINGSICALGQVAGKLFLDSLKHFGGEFEEHLEEKCEAQVCKFSGELN